MIRVRFFKDGSTQSNEDELIGFEISGHGGMAFGKDILCAAVSSAAYYAANTITDIVRASVLLELSDGRMKLLLKDSDKLAECRLILKGLDLHLAQLQSQYPGKMKIEYGGY